MNIRIVFRALMALAMLVALPATASEKLGPDGPSTAGLAAGGTEVEDKVHSVAFTGRQ